MTKPITFRNPETDAEHRLFRAFEHVQQELEALRMVPDLADQPFNMDSRRFRDVLERELDSVQVRYAMLCTRMRHELGIPEAPVQSEAAGTALDDFDYNQLWDAIDKATRLEAGVIAISVRKFRAALSGGDAE